MPTFLPHNLLPPLFAVIFLLISLHAKVCHCETSVTGGFRHIPSPNDLKPFFQQKQKSSSSENTGELHYRVFFELGPNQFYPPQGIPVSQQKVGGNEAKNCRFNFSWIFGADPENGDAEFERRILKALVSLALRDNPTENDPFHREFSKLIDSTSTNNDKREEMDDRNLIRLVVTLTRGDFVGPLAEVEPPKDDVVVLSPAEKEPPIERVSRKSDKKKSKDKIRNGSRKKRSLTLSFSKLKQIKFNSNNNKKISDRNNSSSSDEEGERFFSAKSSFSSDSPSPDAEEEEVFYTAPPCRCPLSNVEQQEKEDLRQKNAINEKGKIDEKSNGKEMRPLKRRKLGEEKEVFSRNDEQILAEIEDRISIGINPSGSPPSQSPKHLEEHQQEIIHNFPDRKKQKAQPPNSQGEPEIDHFANNGEGEASSSDHSQNQFNFNFNLPSGALPGSQQKFPAGKRQKNPLGAKETALHHPQPIGNNPDTENEKKPIKGGSSPQQSSPKHHSENKATHLFVEEEKTNNAEENDLLHHSQDHLKLSSGGNPLEFVHPSHSPPIMNHPFAHPREKSPPKNPSKTASSSKPQKDFSPPQREMVSPPQSVTNKAAHNIQQHHQNNSNDVEQQHNNKQVENGARFKVPVISKPYSSRPIWEPSTSKPTQPKSGILRRGHTSREKRDHDYGDVNFPLFTIPLNDVGQWIRLSSVQKDSENSKTGKEKELSIELGEDLPLKPYYPPPPRPSSTHPPAEKQRKLFLAGFRLDSRHQLEKIAHQLIVYVQLGAQVLLEDAMPVRFVEAKQNSNGSGAAVKEAFVGFDDDDGKTARKMTWWFRRFWNLLGRLAVEQSHARGDHNLVDSFDQFFDLNNPLEEGEVETLRLVLAIRSKKAFEPLAFVDVLDCLEVEEDQHEKGSAALTVAFLPQVDAVQIRLGPGLRLKPVDRWIFGTFQNFALSTHPKSTNVAYLELQTASGEVQRSLLEHFSHTPNDGSKGTWVSAQVSDEWAWEELEEMAVDSSFADDPKNLGKSDSGNRKQVWLVFAELEQKRCNLKPLFAVDLNKIRAQIFLRFDEFLSGVPQKEKKRRNLFGKAANCLNCCFTGQKQEQKMGKVNNENEQKHKTAKRIDLGQNIALKQLF